MWKDSKWDVDSVSNLVNLIVAMPPEVRTLQFIAFILIVTDTMTGVIRYAAARSLSSRRMRLNLLYKLSAYFGLVILGAAATIVSKSWLPVTGAYYAILAIEATSILENVAVFAKQSGIHLEAGPTVKFINLLGVMFEATQDKTTETGLLVQSTTYVPQKPQNDRPATNITSVETTSVETIEKPMVLLPNIIIEPTIEVKEVLRK